jgi:hypothetical protein
MKMSETRKAKVPRRRVPERAVPERPTVPEPPPEPKDFLSRLGAEERIGAITDTADAAYDAPIDAYEAEIADEEPDDSHGWVGSFPVIADEEKEIAGLSELLSEPEPEAPTLEQATEWGLYALHQSIRATNRQGKFIEVMARCWNAGGVPRNGPRKFRRRKK